ncbi:hypothetical protein DFJ73DRAFT_956142 [Zopfochytrium polystomum]|nr:hypothetical protein DFJ73DRAFT_956142 [Zopfochytrium polystomum]
MEELVLEVSHRKVTRKSKKKSKRTSEALPSPIEDGPTMALDEEGGVEAGEPISKVVHAPPTDRVDLAALSLGTNVDFATAHTELYDSIPQSREVEYQVNYPGLDLQPQLEPYGLEATAPPLEDQDWNIEQFDVSPTQTVSPSNVALKPLDEDVLFGLHENFQLAAHGRLVEEFRRATNQAIDRDFFFERVNEYFLAWLETNRAKSRLKSLQSSINSITSRLWILRKSSGTADDKCLDGVRITHSFASEEAQLSAVELEDLQRTLESLKKEVVHGVKSASFSTKMAKLWIQNYIDNTLATMAFQQTDGVPESTAILHHCIDVLFFFERKCNSGTGPIGEDVDSPTTQFLRDTRGWISHLTAALLKCATLLDHRYILLHVLRTTSIGSWGQNFVQWAPPTIWTSDYLDHFLTSFHAFLGPIEEVEEEIHLQDAEDGLLKESLRKLEESDWIVVDEEEVGNAAKQSRVTILEEADYLALFGQFNLPLIFGSYVKSCLSDYRQEKESNGNGERHLLRLFAVTCQLYRIGRRAFKLFPVHEYPNLLKRVAFTLVDIISVLVNSITSGLSHWLNELSYDQNPLETFIYFGEGWKTTIQAELDAAIYRVVTLFLSSPRSGVWILLPTLKLSPLSDLMKWRIITQIILGPGSKLESGIPMPQVLLSESQISSGLETLLLGEADDRSNLIAFLSRVVASNAVDGDSLSHGDFLFKRDMAIVVAHSLFNAGLVHTFFRESCQKFVRDALVRICSQHPDVISNLLQWSREKFLELGPIALFLFQGLPISTWQPNLGDLGVVSSMLKDPETSLKFQVAKFIVDNLNWGFIDDTEELWIPRSHHRFVGVSIINVYLDRLTMKEPRTILSTTSALASTALSSVGAMGLSPSNDVSFADWCWSVVLRLKLYQRPTSSDTYTLETFGQGSKPFEPLESASLATLRGAMKTNALAAYVVLMITDIGHDRSKFHKQGWKLMAAISQHGNQKAIVNIVNEVLLEFVRVSGVAFCSSTDFESFFPGYCRKWASRTKLQGKSQYFAHDPFILAPSLEWTYSSVPLLLWLKVILSDAEWPMNQTSMHFLDMICEVAILFHYDHVVSNEFTSVYRQLVRKYANQAKASGKLSLRDPVGTVVNIATAIGDVYTTYPSLIPGQLAEWLANVPNAIRPKLFGEKENIWYAFEALFVETMEETDSRQNLGHSIVQDPLVSFPQLSRLTAKPLTSFSIFLWAYQILAAPSDHPVMPLMWQVFFSLYFESAPGGRSNSMYGHRFFALKGDLIPKLEKKLTDCIRSTPNDSIGPEVALLKAKLDRLYNAMLLWISETRFTHSPLTMESLKEVHCPSELKEVQTGLVLSSRDARWMHLVPCEPLIRRYQNLFKTEGSSKSDSRRNSAAVPLSVGTAINASVPAPIFASRQPLVPVVQAENGSHLLQVIEQNIQLVKEKGIPFYEILKDMDDLDAKYVKLAQRLYTNVKKRGRIEKRCGSSCSGGAVINFSFCEVKLQTDVKNDMRENRHTSISLSDWDNMDAKVCTAMLRSVVLMECLSEATSLDTAVLSQSTVRDIQRLFFKMVASLTDEQSEYPPVAFIRKKVVDIIGQHFIANSEEQSLKVFELIKNVSKESPLLSIFTPSVCIESFPEMYLSSAMNFDRTEAFYRSVMERFSVADWLSDCAPSLPLVEKLVEYLLDIVTRTLDPASSSTMSPSIVEIHLDALSAILQHPKSEKGLVQLISAVAKAVLNGAPLICGEVVLKVLTGESKLNRDIVESPDLIDLKISRDATLALHKSFVELLTPLRRSGVYNMQDGALSFAVDLSIVSSTSKELLSMMSEVDHVESWSRLREIFLVWLGIAESENATLYVVPWADSNKPKVEEVLVIVCKLLTKSCRSNKSMVDLIASSLWGLMCTIIPLNPPTVFFEPVFKVFKEAVDWSQASLTPPMLRDVNNWLSEQTRVQETEKFLIFILSVSRPSPSDAREDRYLGLLVYFTLLGRLEGIPFSESERKTLLLGLSANVKFLTRGQNWTKDEYRTILATLPRSWMSQLTSTANWTVTENCLGCTILLLKFVGSFVVEKGDVITSNDSNQSGKVELYLEFLFDLLALQTAAASTDSLQTVSATPFAVDALDSVVFETVLFSENTAIRLFGSSDEILPFVQQRVYGIVNGASKGSREFMKVWGGVLRSLASSSTPLTWMSSACAILASSEHMALVCEAAIDLHLRSHFAKGTKTSVWKPVLDMLRLPDLEMDSFVRWCLSHALILTLYAHAVQKLLECGANPDLRLAIGEQLGTWIGMIKMESAAEDATGEASTATWSQSLPSVLKAGKLVLPLELFATLLSEELAALPLPEHHSRLRACLSPIAESMLRWGEDRANQGLWAALGFGPRSKLAPEFRLFSRATGTFIAMRLLGWTGEKRDAEHKSRLVAAVSAIAVNREYEACWGRVDELVAWLNDEDGKRLPSLREFILLAGSFSAYRGWGWKE